jgi:hypothetical protein
MEKLIFIAVVVILSLLHAWWKKRQEAGEDESNPWPGYPPRHKPKAPPAPRPAPPPSPAASWEEELRRLLQGEEPARPASPPVVVVQQPHAAPPPLPRGAATRPAPAPHPVFVEQVDPDMEKGLPVKMPSLEQSAQAYLHASQLESRVAERMHRVDQLVTTHQKLESKKPVAPEIRQAISLLRQRQSQRAAILAGIILGPPKAMEG